MDTLAAARFRFGDFEMDCGRRSLTRQGETLALTSKAFELLQQLVENHGRFLSKDELMDRVWPGQFVEENNLTVQISALRKIFGDKSGAFRFITTVPGKGYSFIETVEQMGVDGPITALQIASVSGFYDGESIFGRAKEIAEIGELLDGDDGGPRLIVLTGAGGSGKTRLARAVVAEVHSDFPDGVFFVELAAVSTSELVTLAINEAIGIEESGEATPVEILKEHLRTRQILLVLDNFEQLTSAAGLLKELIAASSSLRILVTSRIALRLSIECEFAVLPLSVPPRDAALSAAASNEYAAIRLFAARAQTSKKGFALTEENAAAVADICRRLDGLPLAIELAAARVRLLSVDAILARLENSLQLLTGGANDLPERQRTMRAAIEWSCDLLDDDARRLFQRLAVFVGGFTVEAAEAIADEDAAGVSVLDLLTSLLDNNLLVLREQEDGGTRLQMLEVVRDFAFEMLRETGELDDIRERHARFFLALAEEAEPLLLGEKGVEWLARLESDHDNFRSALSWSLTDDHEIAPLLAAALSFFWLGHTHFNEGLRWCNAVIAATENSISEARARILVQTGAFLRHRGEFEAAREIIETCLTESRELNNKALIEKSVHGLGCIAVVQKDFTAAEDFYLEALALSRERNDERRIAYTLGSLGDLEMCKGNHSAARVFLEECRTLAEKLGDRPVQTTIYYNLGAIDYFEGLYQDAAAKFARSLQICEEMGFKSMMSCALDGFAALAAVSGNFARSAQLAGAVDSLREAIAYNNEPAEEAFRDEFLTIVRSALDGGTFDANYQKGRKMSVIDAIALINKRPQLHDGQTADDEMTEIIIEKRSISRIIIDG